MQVLKNRPKIKIRLNSADWLVELLGLAFLIIIIVLPLIYFRELPDKIPTHFNGAGHPDGYGSKATLFLFPGIGLFLYSLLTIISFFPHISNYPVKITPKNAEIQYRLANRLLRILKALMLMMFAYICFQTIKMAAGKSAGPGTGILPVLILLTLGATILYIVQSLNNREPE
jgi:uncharacterized membrane protein